MTWNMSLKLRLNLMITMLLLLMMAIGAWTVVKNAREDVRAELDSTAKLALYLLDAEVSRYSEVQSRSKQPFRLQSLSDLRHLKLEFFDAQGALADSNVYAPHAGNVEMPPAWFIRVMDLSSAQWQSTRRVIMVNGRIIGELVITPDPSYELAEVWSDAKDTFALALFFFVAVNIMVYWAVDRALRPVEHILEALNELELGNLGARLPAFKLSELHRISDKFNLMASKLQDSVRRNHLLAQQLISAQEDERKNLARELHDEIGQSLTAINADATAILNNDHGDSAIKASASAIVDVARHVVAIVRDMLEHLRPDTLKLGLDIALHELVDAWRQRNARVETNLVLADDLGQLGELAPITVYRIVQECLTNVTRHAQAQRVGIHVALRKDCVEVSVRDDGKGFDQATRVSGFGLAGMRERVEGLGGSFMIETSPNQGTHILALVPVSN
jgi:two-component system sensor histidine kinase UhpB